MPQLRSGRGRIDYVKPLVEESQIPNPKAQTMLKTKIQKWENDVGYAQFLGFEALGICLGLELGLWDFRRSRLWIWFLELPPSGGVEHFVSGSVEHCEDWTLKL